jgi:hypothetical protein
MKLISSTPQDMMPLSESMFNPNSHVSPYCAVGLASPWQVTVTTVADDLVDRPNDIVMEDLTDYELINSPLAPTSPVNSEIGTREQAADIFPSHNVDGDASTLIPSSSWTSSNDEVISRLSSRLSLADNQVKALLEELKKLDFSIPLPHNVRSLRKSEGQALRSSEFNVLTCPVVQPRGKFNEPMLEYESYDLINYDIMETCLALINIKEHAAYLHWQFEPEFTSDGVSPDPHGPTRLYAELWQCNWWRDQQCTLPSEHANIWAIMLSSDETMVTLTGRKLHPVYVFCGNYPRWFCARQSGWALLGFMPVIRACKGYTSRESIRTYRRAVKRWALLELLRPMLERRDGVQIRCPSPDGTTIDKVVFPRMPFFVGDEPEVMATVTSGMRGACQRPCTNCDLCPSQEVDMELPYANALMTRGDPRSMLSITEHFNTEDMSSTMPPDVSLYLSVHPEFNVMFYVPGLNPFNNPSCRMHQTDHGIFKNLLQTVTDFFKRYGRRGAVNYFDHRWRRLNPFPKMKQFRRGVSSLTYVTATDHRWMTMCLPFAVRNLDVELGTCRDSGLPRHFIERVAITYLAWRWVLGADGQTMASVQTLSRVGMDLQRLIALLTWVTYDKKILEGPKYHKIIHWPEWILLFGCTGNYNAEVFECAHKFTVKRWTRKLKFIGSYPERRVMQQTQVYDSHLTDSVEDLRSTASTDAHRPIAKRTGPGGFRGKHDLIAELALSHDQLNALRRLETSTAFSIMSVEEVSNSYRSIVTGCSIHVDVSAVSAILQTNKAFMEVVDATESKDLIRFFIQSSNRVVFFKKTWCSPSSAYASKGTDVSYKLMHRGLWHNRFGRVKWMLQIGTRYFIVMQRMTELPQRDGPRAGEDAPDRMYRQSEMLERVGDAAAPDPLRLNCRYLTITDSFDVLYLGRDGSETGYLEAVIMTQPDFTTLRMSPDGTSELTTHLFLVEYVIQ